MLNRMECNKIMGKLLDLVGRKFFRLTVVEFAGVINGTSRFRCVCDCGVEKIIRSNNLMSGDAKSCGCWNRERITNQTKGLNILNNKLYRVWGDMKSRCNNPNDTCFKNYGGRGITVCSEWNESSELFGEWALSNGYAKGLTIDRIDNNGNYSPDNCKWSTKGEQGRNQRSNVFVTINGITKILPDWAAEWNLNPNTVVIRYRNGDRGDRLSRPVATLVHSTETKAKMSASAKIRLSTPSNNPAYKDIPKEQLKATYLEKGTVEGTCEVYGICITTFHNKIRELGLKEWYSSVNRLVNVR